MTSCLAGVREHAAAAVGLDGIEALGVRGSIYSRVRAATSRCHVLSLANAISIGGKYGAPEPHMSAGRFDGVVRLGGLGAKR